MSKPASDEPAAATDEKSSQKSRMACREIPLDEVKKLTHHKLLIEGIEIFFPF